MANDAIFDNHPQEAKRSWTCVSRGQLVTLRMFLLKGKGHYKIKINILLSRTYNEHNYPVRTHDKLLIIGIFFIHLTEVTGNIIDQRD